MVQLDALADNHFGKCYRKWLQSYPPIVTYRGTMKLINNRYSVTLVLFFISCTGARMAVPESGRSTNCSLTLSGAINGTFPCEVVKAVYENGTKISFNLNNKNGSSVVSNASGTTSQPSRAVQVSIPYGKIGEFQVADYKRASESGGKLASVTFVDHQPTLQGSNIVNNFNKYDDQIKGTFNLKSQKPYIGELHYSAKGTSGKITIQGRFQVD